MNEGYRRGALNIETIEVSPIVSDGKVSDLVKQEENRATELIEDFMIAANEVVARMLDASKSEQYLFRIYEKLGISNRVELVLYSLKNERRSILQTRLSTAISRVPVPFYRSFGMTRTAVQRWRRRSSATRRSKIYVALARSFGLTLTSHNAKMPYADREPQGDSRSDRQAQRMERIPKRMAPNHQRRRLEEFCRRSEKLEELGRGGSLCGVRYKSQQVQADRDYQIQMENGLHPIHSESRRLR